jgi:hypothetical protein
MEWLAALEQTGLSTWVRESGSIWAYPTILTLHTLGLGVVVGASAALDLRLLGFGRRIPLADFGGLFTGMWWGFALNAVTGVLLFASDATTKGIQQIFYVKLVCIALAVFTMVRLKSAVYGVGPDRAAITPRTTRLAVASLIFWAGAITAGRFMAYL